MQIDGSDFGSITIDGKTYEHDVVIRLSGQVEKRQKKLSKEQYGTSHIISKAEAKSVYEDGCNLLIIGAGQEGNMHPSPEASAYFEKKGCRVIVEPTPEAIRSFNHSREKKIALMHVTC
ncbi:MAG TPA: MTH938/NDUFAF3 family protein [Methylocella sp.]|nr:MTH938/NDUFAF3 family protein [Methylocella sp.]